MGEKKKKMVREEIRVEDCCEVGQVQRCKKLIWKYKHMHMCTHTPA